MTFVGVEGALRVVDDRCGSVDGYLAKIGVTQDKRAYLKEKYLT